MKGLKVNEAETAGTHLQGYVYTSFDHLVSVLGEPERYGSTGKVQVQWALKYGPYVMTIYDWKEYGRSPESVREWHIGGHDQEVIHIVSDILGVRASGRGW
jgi:hypothetical protein